MKSDFVKQIVALVVSVLTSSLIVAWGFVCIDTSVQRMSVLERLTPLLVSSMFACALVMTALRYAISREDLFD